MFNLTGQMCDQTGPFVISNPKYLYECAQIITFKYNCVKSIACNKYNILFKKIHHLG